MNEGHPGSGKKVDFFLVPSTKTAIISPVPEPRATSERRPGVIHLDTLAETGITGLVAQPGGAVLRPHSSD